MSSIFGHSEKQATSSSNNANLGLVNSTYSPVANTGVQAGDQIAAMLGLNGPQGQNQAFKNWQDSTGYQFGLNQGLQSINGNAAAQGILNSGATAKALETYGQNYANTQYANYLSPLQNLLGSGLQAGSLLANVGQQSSSKEYGGGQNGGIGGLISSGIGMLLGK